MQCPAEGVGVPSSPCPGSGLAPSLAARSSCVLFISRRRPCGLQAAAHKRTWCKAMPWGSADTKHLRYALLQHVVLMNMTSVETCFENTHYIALKMNYCCYRRQMPAVQPTQHDTIRYDKSVPRTTGAVLGGARVSALSCRCAA